MLTFVVLPAAFNFHSFVVLNISKFGFIPCSSGFKCSAKIPTAHCVFCENSCTAFTGKALISASLINEYWRRNSSFSSVMSSGWT